jgi:hypothetical protein
MRQKGFALILIILIIVAIGIFGWIAYKNSPDVLKKVVSTPLTTLTPHDQTDPNSNKNWILRKTLNGKNEDLIKIPIYELLEYKLWGDYLIYAQGQYSSADTLKIYNFKNGETKTISKLPDVHGLEIFDNTLYFATTTLQSGKGNTYWMSLPPNTDPQIIKGSTGGSVSFFDNHYWLIWGYGDACAGKADYSLIDLVTKKVTHVASSFGGCADGEENIGIDKRDRMLMASHTWDETNYVPVFDYVVAIPLGNTTNKEGVIAKQDMPKGTNSITYLKDMDKLLLSGSQKYLYDFSTKTLSKTDLQEPTPTPNVSESWGSREEMILAELKALGLPKGYKFVLE